MHLLNAQSLAGGQIINKVQLYEQYFPLPFEGKYIVFSPVSKESKCYNFWGDVLSIIIPILNKANIRIIQTGSANERPYNGCIHLMGQTTLNQVFFLIKNSVGLLSTDTFTHHAADSYGVKSTIIVGNNYKNNICAYFNPQNQTVLEPPYEDGQKPCLSLQDPNKSIDKIKPEQIATAVCKMLNLEYDFPYQTIYTGEISLATMSISCCDSIINNQQLGIPSIIMDLTLNFDENILLNQMNVCEVSVITAKPLSDNIFNHHKQSKRIKELIYEITEDNNPDFAQKVIRNGIPLRLVSKLPEDKINELKLKYYEIGIIWPLKQFNPNNIPELKDKDLSNLYFKSARFLFSKGKVYSSKAHLLKDIAINTFDDIIPIVDMPEYWENLDSYKILEKIV